MVDLSYPITIITNKGLPFVLAGTPYEENITEKLNC
jgi:hypothetical protein